MRILLILLFLGGVAWGATPVPTATSTPKRTPTRTPTPIICCKCPTVTTACAATEGACPAGCTIVKNAICIGVYQ